QRESGFNDLWLEISTKARELNIKEPNYQRPNKTSNRFIKNSEQNSPSSALSVKDKFKLIYYEIIDVTVLVLSGKFQQNLIDHLCLLEKFV
ncbi:Hypothetical protein CINCED_3A022667, partial [Cinara cedri]